LRAILEYMIGLEKKGVLFGPVRWRKRRPNARRWPDQSYGPRARKRRAEIAEADPFVLHGLRRLRAAEWTCDGGLARIKVNFSDQSLELRKVKRASCFESRLSAWKRGLIGVG